MITKTFIFIALFLSINACTKAQDTLYFVAGTPFLFVYDGNNDDMPTQYPTLYQYNQDDIRIDTVLTLFPQVPYTDTDFIGLYNRFGHLVVSRSFYTDNEDRITMFTFIDLISLQQDSVKMLYGAGVSNLIVFSSDSIYYSFRPMRNPSQDIGYSIAMQEINIEPKDYNYAYIQGQSGTPIQGFEYLRLYNEASNNNALHISKGYGKKVGPCFELQPPKELYNAYPPAMKSIIVNDFHSMIISYDDSKPDKNRIGEYYCIIYDKLSKEWYKYTFNGNATNVRSYDNGWVAGTIRDMDEGEYYNNKTARYTGEKFDFKRESPGYEERVPVTVFEDRFFSGLIGDCFDERAQYYGTYYPGLLYLFNVHTKDYIEWDTRQGDSEVLLVQDDFVYYRVNTKILKSAIIDNMQLSEPELLIDDERVRDIHWAYLKRNK